MSRNSLCWEAYVKLGLALILFVLALAYAFGALGMARITDEPTGRILSKTALPILLGILILVW